jgi:hypothetical protein
MSQFPHDNFAKNLFELLLSPFGTVNLQHNVRSETKFVDIYFEPNLSIEHSTHLGLLSRCLNQLTTRTFADGNYRSASVTRNS